MFVHVTFTLKPIDVISGMKTHKTFTCDRWYEGDIERHLRSIEAKQWEEKKQKLSDLNTGNNISLIS